MKPMPARHMSSSDDDDFMQPLMKRVKKGKSSDGCSITTPHNSHSPSPQEEESSSTPHKLIETEAEVSDDLFGSDPSDSDDINDTNLADDAYDYDDSFINDASVLTQEVVNCTNRSPESIGDVYRQSLMSPQLGGRGRQGRGNQYRLVMSQRYKLLNHYISKAGLKVSSNRVARRRKAKARPSETDSEAEEVAMFSDKHELLSSEEEEEEKRTEKCARQVTVSSRAIAALKVDKVIISPSLLVSGTVQYTVICVSVALVMCLW